MNNIYTYYIVILLSIVGLNCDLFPPDNALMICNAYVPYVVNDKIYTCGYMKLYENISWDENITFHFYRQDGFDVIEIKYNNNITAHKSLLIEKYNENQLYINKYKDINPLDLADSIRDKLNVLVVQNPEIFKELSLLPDSILKIIKLEFKLVEIREGRATYLYMIVGGNYVTRAVIYEKFYVEIFT